MFNHVFMINLFLFSKLGVFSIPFCQVERRGFMMMGYFCLVQENKNTLDKYPAENSKFKPAQLPLHR